MFRYMVVIMGLSLLCGGCAQVETVTIDGQMIEGAVQRSHRDLQSGNLIALWKEKAQRDGTKVLEPVLVTHPYAMFIYWPKPEWVKGKYAKRVFVFYDNVKKVIYQTKDYDTFLKVVSLQPKNIELVQIETCTVPRCYMPKEQRARLEKVLADGQRTWNKKTSTEDGLIRYCYCYEGKLEFIYPANKS